MRKKQKPVGDDEWAWDEGWKVTDALVMEDFAETRTCAYIVLISLMKKEKKKKNMWFMFGSSNWKCIR